MWGLNAVDNQLRLAFVAMQTHVEATKMIQPLLPSHQGMRLALNAGMWLLNTDFCMIPAEALEVMGDTQGS